MKHELEIRSARPAEAMALSSLARRSKAAWGYPAHWLALWEDDLRISPAQIECETVEVLGGPDEPIAVYVLSPSLPDAELEALWVDPGHMRRGFGSRLLRRAMERARGLGARSLYVDSDPNAQAFYEAHGAVLVGTVASKPEGRRLPRLCIDLDAPDSG